MSKWLVFGTSIIILLLTLSLVSAAVPTPEEIQAMHTKSLETTAKQLAEIAEESTTPDTSLLQDAINYYQRADTVSETSDHQQEIQQLQEKIDSITGGAPPSGGGTPPPSGGTPPPAKAEHKLKLSDVRLDPDTVKCDRETTLSFKISNVGDYDEPNVIVTFSKDELSLDKSYSYTLTNEDGNERSGSYAFTVPEDVAERNYEIIVKALYNTDWPGDVNTVILTVESCGVVDKAGDAIGAAGTYVNDTWTGKIYTALITIAIYLLVMITRGIRRARRRSETARISGGEAGDAEDAVRRATTTTEAGLGSSTGISPGAGTSGEERLIADYRDICDRIEGILQGLWLTTEGNLKHRDRFYRRDTEFVRLLKTLLTWIKSQRRASEALKKITNLSDLYDGLIALRNNLIDQLGTGRETFEHLKIQEWGDDRGNTGKALSPEDEPACNAMLGAIEQAIHLLEEIGIPGDPGDSRRRPAPPEPEWHGPDAPPRVISLPRARKPAAPRIVRVNGHDFDSHAEYIAIVGEDGRLKQEFTVEIDAGDPKVTRYVRLFYQRPERPGWATSNSFPYNSQNEEYLLSSIIEGQYRAFNVGLLEVRFRAITNDDLASEQESEDSAILKIRIEKEVTGAPSGASVGSGSAGGGAVGGSEGVVVRGNHIQLSALLRKNNIPQELLMIDPLSQFVYNTGTGELAINYNAEATREIEGRTITVAPIVRGILRSNSLDNVQGMKIRRPMSSPSPVREIRRTGNFRAMIIADDDDYEIDLSKLGYRPWGKP